MAKQMKAGDRHIMNITRSGPAYAAWWRVSRIGENQTWQLEARSDGSNDMMLEKDANNVSDYLEIANRTLEQEGLPPVSAAGLFVDGTAALEGHRVPHPVSDQQAAGCCIRVWPQHVALVHCDEAFPVLPSQPPEFSAPTTVP
ncbi:MAG: hypothetical protein ACYDBQ_02645 [Thermoplasmatota archaeon]